MSTSIFHWAESAYSRIKTHQSTSATGSVDVVMASDQAFLPYTAVALASIVNSYCDTRPLRVFLLLDRNLTLENRNKFLDIKKIKEFELVEVPVEGSPYEGLRTTPGISVATFYRLQMHRLLPSDCTRVVYLDADIIVRHSIGELFDFDMSGCVMAGVEDSISRNYVSKLGQHPKTKHVNAGVLLLDLEALRGINFSELVQSFIEAKRYTLLLGDQEILTGILGLATKFAPIKWNVHGSMFEKSWGARNVGQLNSMSISEYQDAVVDPAIVHFTYKRKPWVAPDHPRSSEWFKIAKLTAYKNFFNT